MAAHAFTSLAKEAGLSTQPMPRNDRLASLRRAFLTYRHRSPDSVLAKGCVGQKRRKASKQAMANVLEGESSRRKHLLPSPPEGEVTRQANSREANTDEPKIVKNVAMHSHQPSTILSIVAEAEEEADWEAWIARHAARAGVRRTSSSRASDPQSCGRARAADNLVEELEELEELERNLRCYL